MPNCHSCGKPFDNFKDLALHIMQSKSGHRKGRKWASKFIMIGGLSKKSRDGRQQQSQVVLTKEEKVNKVSSARELSGREEYRQVYCPRCKYTHDYKLPVEYIESPVVWRTPQGTMIVACLSCLRSRQYNKVKL